MNHTIRLQFISCAIVFAVGSSFPAQVLGQGPGGPGKDAWSNRDCLAMMKEPQIEDAVKDAGTTIYRLIILPTWGNPVAIRAEKRGATYSLSARRLDGQAGYFCGKLIEQKDVQLSESDSQTLDLLTAKLKFFEMPSTDKIIGKDGDEWVMEGVSGGTYHVVRRWCASDYNPKKRSLTEFLALCKFLVDRSTLSRRPQNLGHRLI